MEASRDIMGRAGITGRVQAGLFARIKAGIAELAERVDRVGHEVAFLHGRLSLALPAPAGRSGSGPDP